MAKRKSWYLLAYDIADPRRLQRTHRYLKTQGTPAQKSVFLVYGNNREIQDIINGVAGIMDPSEDDLRLYPIHHPRALWLRGPHPASIPGMGATKTSALGRLWSKIRKGGDGG